MLYSAPAAISSSIESQTNQIRHAHSEVGPLNPRDSSFSKSLLPLVTLTFIYSVGLIVLASRGVSAPDGSSLFWRFAFGLFMVRWAAIDRRSRSFSVPFEFDAFVFFAWVLVVSYYLLKTRGPRGLI